MSQCLDQKAFLVVRCRFQMEDASGASQLLQNLRVVTARQDAHSWSVLGHKSRQLARLRLHDDQVYA